MLQTYNRRPPSRESAHWRELGAWGDACYHDLFAEAATAHPNEPSVVTERSSVSFDELSRAIAGGRVRLAAASIRPRSVVAVHGPNDASFLVAHLAASSLGAITLPLSRGVTSAEFATLARLGSVDLAIVPAECRSKFSTEVDGNVTLASFSEGSLSLDLPDEGPPAVPIWRDADSEATMVPTAGTTGLPKLALRTHNAWLSMGRKKLDSLAAAAHQRGEKVLVLSPLAQGVGYLHGFIAPLLVPGVCRVLMERFSAEGALDLIQRERPAIVVGIPAQLGMIAEAVKAAPRDLSSVRYFQTGGDHMAPAKRQECEEVLGAPILMDYGASDVGAGCGNRPEDPQAVRLTTAGRPMRWTDLAILDARGSKVPQGEDGEVAMNGPDLISGYYPVDERKHAQWYRTGDVGHLDPGGNLVISGRRRDLIIRGGLNISPAEVQEALVRHADIRNAAVVGIPDPVLGERIGAFVVQQGNVDELHADLRGHLSKIGLSVHKWPERIFYVPQLPVTAVGKVDLAALRARAAGERGLGFGDIGVRTGDDEAGSGAA